MRHIGGDTKNLKDRAEELGAVAQERTIALAASGKSRANRKAHKTLRKIERKLEDVSKRLPVDTPLDRKRHRREQKRGALGAATALVVAAIAVGIGWILRAPRDAAHQSRTESRAQ